MAHQRISEKQCLYKRSIQMAIQTANLLKCVISVLIDVIVLDCENKTQKIQRFPAYFSRLLLTVWIAQDGHGGRSRDV